MKAFLLAFASAIHGTLNGFDRIRFRGTQRHLVYPDGLDQLLWREKVLLKDFADYATRVTGRIWKQTEDRATAQGLAIRFVATASESKEDLAARLAKESGRREGIVAVLSAIEPCRTFVVRKSHSKGRLELRTRTGKCLHYYHYFRDPVLGPGHVRMQTWFPFNVFVCVNGREMLANRLTRDGMAFRQRDNCFSWIEDVPRAQALLDEQVSMPWSAELTRMLDASHPAWRSWPGMDRWEYYWSAEQTEWATDVMFRSGKDLSRRMRPWIEHSLTTLGCADVMRFLGRHVNKTGVINGHYQGEAGTDVVRRPEGTRVSFRVNGNSVKFYDKQGSVLRVETTVNDTREFKSFRPSEREPEGEKDWRVLKKGTSDLPRRTEISQASNERVLESLASVAAPRTVSETVSAVSRRKVVSGRRVRALNVLGEDRALLSAVGRGEHVLNGFRNRDVRALLGAVSSGAVGHRLRLLRAHGVIRKVTATHRYQVTKLGRELLEAVTRAERFEAVEENRETPP